MSKQNTLGDELTPRQRAAIASLLVERDAKAAAAAAHVGYRSLMRWLTQPAFRRALEAAEHELLESVVRRLTRATDLALDALISGMGEEQPIGARVRAADIVLARHASYRELVDYGARIRALEERGSGTP